MRLRIVDIGAEELAACAQFGYRGHVVSASTVFAPRISVQVYDGPKSKEIAEGSREFFSVEAALAWIDERLDGRPLVQTRDAADLWCEQQAKPVAEITGTYGNDGHVIVPEGGQLPIGTKLYTR